MLVENGGGESRWAAVENREGESGRTVSYINGGGRNSKCPTIWLTDEYRRRRWLLSMQVTHIKYSTRTKFANVVNAKKAKMP